ncbi:Aste57867_23960 [Aphanomyces stellatus]|uniref:Aste57867_23960 protein n=1 Tax=Aphanomyces stellatus TaxID=120398 RepID=A0A485LQY8_9STRA|nr:hypothetical protein As57867_023887 [Aphanomyces stellatus]VFU00603.1 Aste57867_23960 [Aphanomyces stellatus]
MGPRVPFSTANRNACPKTFNLQKPSPPASSVHQACQDGQSLTNCVMVRSFFVGTFAALALVHAAQPGQCTNDNDCASYGNGYTCVSVRTTIQNAALASQCVSGLACGGNIAGKCPTFSSWSALYQKIQPLCAFVPVTNCIPTTATTASPKANGVNCYTASFAVNTTSVQVNGIYQCVDAGMYQSQNLGAIASLTTAQLLACKGDATNGGALCNNHGTCAPANTFSSTFQCVCNNGFGGSDNCFKPTSNACDNFGSCGAGNACNATTASCQCSSGTRGNQCSLCDATATNACTNGNGVCNLNGTCTCNAGYVGSLCQTVNQTATGGSSAGTNAAHAPVAASFAVVALSFFLLVV